MDLLSLLRDKAPATSGYMPENEAEAFVAIMYAIQKADGEANGMEGQNMINAVLTKTMFKYYDTELLFEKVGTDYATFGGAAILEGAISIISEQYKKMAFVYCADIVLADGIVHTNEASALQKIAEKFGLDVSFVQSVIDVITAKNMGNKAQ